MQINKGLPDTKVYSLAINTGLTELYILSLAINSEGCIFAGTVFSGVLRSVELTPVQEKTDAIPTSFYLEQNYPNPFNPETIIKFRLPERTAIKLSIYNIDGKLVRTLVNESIDAGYYSVHWDGRDSAGKPVDSGVYFSRLHVVTQNRKSFSTTKKMVLIK